MKKRLQRLDQYCYTYDIEVSVFIKRSVMKKLIALFSLCMLVSAPAFAQKYASVNTKEANIRTCAGTNCAIKWHAWRYTPVIMIKANE